MALLEHKKEMLYCGVDIGTQSIKIIVIDESKNVISSIGENLPKSTFFLDEKGFQCHEQDPNRWWEVLRECFKKVTHDFRKKNVDLREIAGFSLSGTSGTMLFLDKDNSPLTKAFMYNDGRSVSEAQYINKIATSHCEKHGYQFSASFALSKILWLKLNRPEIWKKVRKVNHCVDFIVGKMSEEYGISDYSNALKTGYDLIKLEWPKFIQSELEINNSILPKILNPGDFIAETSGIFQNLTGIPSGIPIFAGLTDSTASLLSSSAVNTGDIFSVLGSTIVEKVISKNIIKDLSGQGRIYSHKFPFGGWIPGGASNVGALTLSEEFGGDQLDHLNSKVNDYTPSNLFVYPLNKVGERFPFSNPYVKGFLLGTVKNIEHKYTGYIEGLCYVEHLMLDVLQDLGADLGSRIYTAGGGTKSDAWMQLRANILGREILIPRIPEASYGSAILVGCVSEFGNNISRACEELIEIKKVYKPDITKIDVYHKNYCTFKEIVKKKLLEEWKKK
jgi:xylulokinase